MHRTGTSMVARLLNLCGVWLGPAHDLVPPAPDNPEGFWENVHLVGLNEILLAAFGGAWDSPPPMPADWQHRPDLDELVLAASELVDRLAASGAWGWKDPRNALTLAFWQRVVPGMRVVICLRNPLEVARSLAERDGMSLAAGFRLWETYYTRLLDDAPPGRSLVTDYAAYFENPARELRRVLVFIGVAPRERTVRRALGAVGSRLHHQHATVADVLDAGAPDSVVALHAKLRGLATEVDDGALDDPPLCAHTG